MRGRQSSSITLIEAALDVLTTYLTRGKKAPFYQVIVEEKKLAPNVNMFNFGSELAGQVRLVIRAFADKDLDEVSKAVTEAFTRV